MLKSPRLGLWFAGTSAIFFTRSFLFSSWVSRGPEVQQALSINTAEMGLLSMIFPVGGLAGILFASRLVIRFGATYVNAATFAVAAIAFGLLGQAIDSGNILLVAACLFITGLPIAISDFLGNYEGSRVDKASKRSLFPAIHAAFGLGMLLGAALASQLINQKISLTASFIFVAVFVGLVSVVAGFAFPRDHKSDSPASSEAKPAKAVSPWLEKRSLLLAVIGFAFIMAETSAGTWVPIALTNNGYSGAAAASAFGFFWVVITIVRIIGGAIVDRIGRYRVVLFSALTTATGMLVFMTSEAHGLPYVGLVLWGVGMAIGFPMVVLSMGDDSTLAAARVNMVITVVYIASISVGPALGALGQAAGIYVAFAIPLVMMLIAALLSKVTKPEVAK